MTLPVISYTCKNGTRITYRNSLPVITIILEASRRHEEEIIMNIIIKSLLNGIVSCLLLALILTLTKGVNFMQALVEPSTLFLAPCAAVGSYFGYRFKAMRKD